MPALRMLRSDELISALKKAGFAVLRQRGSHVRLGHADGQVVTVPVYAGKVIGRGLLRKILRDAELTPDELVELLHK